MKLSKTTIKNLLISKIKSGKIKQITLKGSSMLPTIASNDTVNIVPIKDSSKLKVGDIVVAADNKAHNFIVHRIIEIDRNNKICKLKGDNQNDDDVQIFSFNQIYAKVEAIALTTETKTFIVLDIPFHPANSFNTKTYEIYQSLSANNNCFFFDLNCEFNRWVYDEKKINEFNKTMKTSANTVNNLYNYLAKRRIIYKKIYNLYQFTFSTLLLCDYLDEKKIKRTINNYRSTIYYKFYKERIISFEKFEGLISAVIFSLTLFELTKKKAILIDNATIINGKYDFSTWSKYFSVVLSMSQICRTNKAQITTYKGINFSNYIPANNVATIRFMQECYYKKCLFCDRHSTDNFCYSINNIYNKIYNLSKMNVNRIVFVDDCLVPTAMIKLLELLHSNGINIFWKGTFRFDKALNNEEIICKLKKFGCKMLFFGLESFDQKLLDKMHKGIKINDALAILKLCKKYNIVTSVSLLFDFPGETTHNLKITKKYLKKYLNLIDHCEFNDFITTANCKITDKWDSLSYYKINTVKCDAKKIKIKNDIHSIAKEKTKNSFYLKNFMIWE